MFAGYTQIPPLIATSSQCVSTFSWHLLQPRANAEHDSMSIYFYLSYISHECDNSHWSTVILSERHTVVVKMILMILISLLFWQFRVIAARHPRDAVLLDNYLTTRSAIIWLKLGHYFIKILDNYTFFHRYFFVYLFPFIVLLTNTQLNAELTWNIYHIYLLQGIRCLSDNNRRAITETSVKTSEFFFKPTSMYNTSCVFDTCLWWKKHA